MLVHLGGVRAGERVLVLAAAGGVGQAALQICRWRGAEVIGAASASKHARLAEMGVAHAIDYRTRDVAAEVRRITGGRGVDIVLDPVGGRSVARSYRCLAPLGRLFVFGVSSAAPARRRSLARAVATLLTMPRFNPLRLMRDNRGVFGVNVGHLWAEAPRLRGMLDEIVRLAADGTFDPVVDRAFPFAAAGEAHAYIHARQNFGKVLLTPDA